MLHINFKTVISASLVLTLGVTTPALANPLKSIGKLAEKVEQEAKSAKRKTDSVKATVGNVRRAVKEVGLDNANGAPAAPYADANAYEYESAGEYGAEASDGGSGYDMNPVGGSGSQTYRNVVFPLGAFSFADEVISYDPGSPFPSETYRGAQASLGTPDWKGGSTCKNQAVCTFTSLGSGGNIVVQFTDNVLTGSGDDAIDLWIFEVGPDVEDMSVEISADGYEWQSVGTIGGGKSGVDIDAFGLDRNSSFSFVRLTDDPSRGQSKGATAGADIDAVGAISTRAKQAAECTCP